MRAILETIKDFSPPPPSLPRVLSEIDRKENYSIDEALNTIRRKLYYGEKLIYEQRNDQERRALRILEAAGMANIKYNKRTGLRNMSTCYGQLIYR